MKHVIVSDTICEGEQAECDADTGEVIVYPTLEAARAEIESVLTFYDDYDAFALPLDEYIEGRKAIWTPDCVPLCKSKG